MLVDTSGLFAALDRSQREHGAARAAMEADDGPFVLSPFVLAEVDHLLATRVSVDAPAALLADVAAGAYELAPFAADDVAVATAVVEQHRGLGIGLADASLVVLAARTGTDAVLTLDERRFRALRVPDGRPFRLLPADL